MGFGAYTKVSRTLATVLLAVACNGDDNGVEDRNCNQIACGEPFVVRIDMGELAETTTLHVDADGETFTIPCPPPGGEGQGAYCEPDESVGGAYRVTATIWNEDDTIMVIAITGPGTAPVGPDHAEIEIASGGATLFAESFDAEGRYGEGIEINGPGCGRCYGPVEFSGSLDVPPRAADAGADASGS